MHTAIIQTSPKPSISSPTQQHTPTLSVSTTDNYPRTLHSFREMERMEKPPSTTHSTDIRISNDSQIADDDETEDAEKQERKRLRREKKKEQKRLKKLEKGGD